MKFGKSKLLGIGLALTAFGLVAGINMDAQHVKAEESVTEYNVWVNGTEFTSANASTGIKSQTATKMTLQQVQMYMQLCLLF